MPTALATTTTEASVRPAGTESRAAAAPPSLLSRLSPTDLVMTGLLGVAFVACFQFVLIKQFGHSATKPADWGHAFLVPLISSYLLYQHRTALASVRVAPFWPGILPLVLGVTCYFFAVTGVKNHMVSGWSMILALFGLVLLMLGPAVMRYAFFPIAYLACGITVSDQIMLRITSYLQQVASEGSYVVLEVLGISTDIKGSTLTIFSSAGEAIPLNIAEACSGLRMLIAFVALGAAMALVACRHWWQRVALLVLAVPVALFINIMRVVVLAIASLFNPHLAEGEAHIFIGTLLLIPGFLLYVLLVWILNKAVTEPSGAVAPATAPAPRRAGEVRP